MIWTVVQATPVDQPKAVNGVLDLRGWDFKQNGMLRLDGEWEFYPSERIVSLPIESRQMEAKRSLIKVPHSWNEAMTPPSPYGYGSYRLRILLDADAGESLAIRSQGITVSSELFIDGVMKAHSGQTGDTAERYHADPVLYTAEFTAGPPEIDVIIQAANYDNSRGGGITQSLLFGELNAVNRHTSFSISMQLLLCVLLTIHAVYAIIIYWIATRERTLIQFAMINISMIVMTLLVDDRILLTWAAIPFEWYIRLVYLSLINVNIFLVQFAFGLMPNKAADTFRRVYTWVSLFCLLLTLFIPYHLFYTLGIYYYLIGFFAPMSLIWLFWRAVMRGEEDSIYLLIGSIAVNLNIMWGFLRIVFPLEMYFYPIDLIVAFLAFVSFWFKRYFRTAERTKKLAYQLQLADKQKDDFLANTSHELRNPLHGMLNIAQSMLDTGRVSMDNRSRDNLELIVKIGRRMSFLLGDLLDIARLREQGIVLHRSPVRIQALVEGVIDMLRFMTDGKPVRFENHIPPAFPQIDADENRAVQILFNLLHNAVKFTQEGTITVQAQRNERTALITIADTGIGMTDETLQRIFQPYEQGNTGSSVIGGIGLGLSIAKQLTELHGGTLEVHSVPDEGTTFTFTLPLAETLEGAAEDGGEELLPLLRLDSEPYSPDAADEDRSIQAQPGAGQPEVREGEGPHVLAVDDDALNLNILVELLSSEGCRVVTATSGYEALELLDTKSWDLVISDVMMPQMSGYELTRSIRERFSLSELPILHLTARSRTEDIQAGFQSGANDYVMKPVEAKELKSRVRALTDMKASVQERLRLEAAWLQAQIQPHFLFNTLNSIAALSQIDSSRMQSLLEAFGDYLQTSFHITNTERLVPLQHELSLVHSYLFIEKERFGERLNVVWNVDPVNDTPIPPLTIQPLVENAVRHGICHRIRGGTITITIESHGNGLDITIQDDGAGIESHVLQSLLNPGSERREGGIGLLNIDRRLKQIYGSGLRLSSVPNEGTTVSFKVWKDR